MPNRNQQASQFNEDVAIVIVKAAPQVGQKHGETVCCAGLDLYGNWLRLYPVSFRQLSDSQKFGRWDRIKFRSRRPSDDPRIESRRVVAESIEIVGQLRPSERQQFLDKSIVTSLKRQRDQGKSLALIRPDVIDFIIESKSDDDTAKERSRLAEATRQADMFAKSVAPYKPCPFEFKYKYRIDDGERLGTCQDWELEATYFNWSREYGKEEALERIKRVFGEEYPKKGMLLAMGTHSQYPDTWLINGVIRLDNISQHSLF
jgi:hypothetical protein